MTTEFKAKQVEIEGVVYESVPEPCSYDCCEGCVAGEDTSLCKELGYYCCQQPIVWIKKEKTEATTEMKPEPQTENKAEPKYTIEEFSEAFSNCVGTHVSEWDMIQIKKYLAKQSSPEYQLYLKLKKQFGE